MPIRHDPFQRPPWEEQDSKNLFAFLATQTGKRLIFRLQNDRPSIGGSKGLQQSMEANALWAKEIRGYERAVRNLFDYLNTPVDEKARAEAYPSIDAEAHWPEELRAKPELKAPDPTVQTVPNEAEQTPAEIVPDKLPQPEK